MSFYILTDQQGFCDMCEKTHKGINLYKCPHCEFMACPECWKKGPQCACNNGIPPLEGEQQAKMDILVEMGFPNYICYHALKTFNWEIDPSIPWILENMNTFPRPKVKEINRPEIKVDEFENDDLDNIEDLMKYKEKKEEKEVVEKKKGKKKKKGGKRHDDKEPDEYNEGILDDDIYKYGRDFQNEISAENCYEIIENEKIIQMIKNMVQKQSEIFCMDEGIMSLLLKAHNWSPDKLQDRLFENYDEVLKQEDIILEPQETEGEEGLCNICFDEAKLIGLNCGHKYCQICWKERIKTMLDQVGADIVNTKCMQKGCNCTIHYKLVEEIEDKLLLKRFMYFLTKDFISHQKTYVFCPVDTCGRSIHFINTSQGEVPIKCICGQKFCFYCGREMHKPVTCEQFMEWHDLVTNDSENMKFVNTISKPCFHCGLYTERTDGCNHMTCPRCRGEWCWMCRGDWKTHGDRTGGFYKCNLYEKSEAKKLDDQAKQLKEENSVFLSYFDEYIKYSNKIRDLNARGDILGKVQEKVEVETGKQVPEIFLALEICKEAYNIIRYSHVYLYFMKDYEQISRLYKFRQDRDTKTVNELFEMLDQLEYVDFDTLQELRRKIKLVKSAIESLTNVSTETLMKNRYDTAKKKKDKK